MSNPGPLGSRAWRELRVYVLDRDGGLCQIRGPGCTKWATEVDHITSRADGGAIWDDANLRAACRHCNLARAGRYGNRRGGQFTYRTPQPRFETRL
ncbi:MAG TPA: HNH endonuclease signature motif containing protein [Acidimicrobiales bacterium]|nr:HNH endonuclease signature motif containing protein [Acidimicrobiales bacterium]